MPRKKKLPQISVSTVANGYVLTFDKAKHDFMYFSPEKLIEGFMVHIGLKMTDQLTEENIRNFIDATVNWKDTAHCMKEIERLKVQVQNAIGHRNGMARRLIHERERCLTLIEILKAPTNREQKLRTMNMMVRNYGSLKKLTPKDLGITSEAVTDEELEGEADE